MPGCTCLNCTNHSRHGFRFYGFPGDHKRREISVKNCGRDQCESTKYLRVCEKHFELNQYENNRPDGKNILKPNAIPTLFNVSNSPEAENTTSLQDTTKDDVGESVEASNTILNNVKQLWRIEKELQRLKKKNKQLQNVINYNPFLGKELKEILCRGNKVCKWSPQLIQKANQIRFAVGWKGYIYLRKSMQFCLPSYNTICRHFQKLSFNSGLLEELLTLLADKRRELKHESENECLLLMDKMEIKELLEYDRSTGSYVSYSAMQRDATKRKLEN